MMAVILDVEATYPLNADISKELIAYVKEVYATEVPVEEGATRETINKFASRQLCLDAAQTIANRIDTPQFDPAMAYTLIDRAMEISHAGRGVTGGYSTSPLPGKVDDRPGLRPLYLSDKLDLDLGGGCANGELIVVVAPPSGGKTTALCITGSRNAKRGGHPLHISMEINRLKVIRRYDSEMTNMGYTDLMKNPDVVRAKREAMVARGGDVYIEDWSYRNVTPAHIQGHVQRMRAIGQSPDMVIVDYLELMEPNPRQSRARVDIRHEMGRLGKELRQVAVRLDIPIITAWQINRIGSTVPLIQREHLSECWDIVKHADTIISMNQLPEEDRINEARLGILKQRNSSKMDHVVRVNYDKDACQIWDKGVYNAINTVGPGT